MCHWLPSDLFLHFSGNGQSATVSGWHRATEQSAKRKRNPHFRLAIVCQSSRKGRKMAGTSLVHQTSLCLWFKLRTFHKHFKCFGTLQTSRLSCWMGLNVRPHLLSTLVSMSTYANYLPSLQRSLQRSWVTAFQGQLLVVWCLGQCFRRVSPQTWRCAAMCQEMCQEMCQWRCAKNVSSCKHPQSTRLSHGSTSSPESHP